MTVGAVLTAAMAAPFAADACSRAVYFGKDGQTVTGRTMDWVVPDMSTNLWVSPRGLARNSNTKAPVNWKSKYGSVATAIYEGATADGMNEKGMVANLLYLVESKYPLASADDKRPTLPISAWAQYVLDNYATTAEAVEGLRREEFRVVPIQAPTGEAGTVHLAISDASGDSAIFEYIDGKLRIHHGKQYQIMTNSPTYDQQLSLADYWKEIGGSTFLPGTNRATDRFVRLSYYVNETTQSAQPREAVATVFSIMRNVSVPIGIKTPGKPNVADTLWLTVADQKNKVYYFQSTQGPEHSLGQAERARSQRGVGRPQAAARRQPRYRRRSDQRLQARRAVQVHRAARVSDLAPDPLILSSAEVSAMKTRFVTASLLAAILLAPANVALAQSQVEEALKVPGAKPGASRLGRQEAVRQFLHRRSPEILEQLPLADGRRPRLVLQHPSLRIHADGDRPARGRRQSTATQSRREREEDRFRSCRWNEGDTARRIRDERQDARAGRDDPASRESTSTRPSPASIPPNRISGPR